VRSSAKTKAVRASIGDIAPKASEIQFVEADRQRRADLHQFVLLNRKKSGR
jgi:hypothetical protein